MNWILLAVLGQFLNAIVAFLDKFIVSDKRVNIRPFPYAFYSCVITGGWVLVYLLGAFPGMAALGVPQFSHISAPSIEVVAMSFLAAYTFFSALVSLYTSLQRADASDVVPVVGAVSAVCSYVLSHLLLPTPTSPHFLAGISLLVFGTILVSHFRFDKTVAFYAIHSGLFFALHYITLKGLFTSTSFDDGFFWSRIGLVVFALSLLILPNYWQKITTQTKSTTARGGFLVLGVKVLAGVAAFLLLKATDMGDVAVVQALDGLKFVFIVALGVMFGSLLPDSAGENDNSAIALSRKLLYSAIITAGLVLLLV